MRIVVVAATSVIAKSCIAVWAKNSAHQFVLAGRTLEKLELTAQDLRLRFPNSSFEVGAIDFQSSDSIQSFVSQVATEPIDMVLIAQGSLTEQPAASTDLNYLKAQLDLNAVSVALVLESFAGVMEKANRGTIGVIGSVAGDRGRAYNYSYGSSKALIETYAQGLQQRLASTNVSVCLIKPGPTATPMTENHRGRMADPQTVAKVIVRGLAAKRRVIYAPRIWAAIMFVVRLIPFTVFKRLNF